MSKVSIDLRPNPAAFRREEGVTALTIGCLRALKNLGNKGRMIEVFRITYAQFEKDAEEGPIIRVHFRDPLGAKGSYETDYRFIGRHDVNPTAEEIAEHLCCPKGLPEELRRHLERGKAALDAATRHITSLEG